MVYTYPFDHIFILDPAQLWSLSTFMTLEEPFQVCIIFSLVKFFTYTSLTGIIIILFGISLACALNCLVGTGFREKNISSGITCVDEWTSWFNRDKEYSRFRGYRHVCSVLGFLRLLYCFSLQYHCILYYMGGGRDVFYIMICAEFSKLSTNKLSSVVCQNKFRFCIRFYPTL